MATQDRDFVTAEGLAKVMQEVGGGVDVLAEVSRAEDVVTYNVSGYRFVVLIGAVTYGSNNGVVSCLISPELIGSVQAEIPVGCGFDAWYYFGTSVDVGGNLTVRNLTATLLQAIGIK